MLLNIKDNRYSLSALLIVILSIGYLVFREIPINVFSNDILGYYLYLPAAFNYEDLALNNYDKLQGVLSQYNTSEGFYQAFKVENGNWVIKYPMGMSVLYAPFYFIGDIIASNTKAFPSDGFSRPYQLSVLYGCYLYTVLGLFAFRKVLLHFFSDKIAAIVILLLVFGTNYLVHVSIHAQPAMSHNLLFSLHAFTLLFTLKWHDSYKFKYLLGLSITIGLTAITRPPEALIALVPFLYGVSSFQSLKQQLNLFFITYQRQVIAAALVVIVIISYQLVYWKIITGKFVFDSYSDHLNEGFNFKHPYFLEFLFSFRKGWLLFTPIMTFAIIGFYFFYKEGKTKFFAFFCYFILIFYICMSWSNWWYGTSYSSRAIIPAYAVLAIPMGYLLKSIFNYRVKFIIIPIILCMIALNLFQSWQTSKGILDGSRMTRAFYNSTFLQTTLPTEEQKKLLLKDKYSSQSLLDINSINLNDYKLVYRQEENFDGLKKEEANISDSVFASPKFSFMTDENNAFAGDIRKNYIDITEKSYLILKLSAKVFTRYNPNDLEARLAITMMHRGKGYDFKCIEIGKLGLKPNEWNSIEFYMWTTDFWDRRDVIQSYFWNMSNKPIFVDDLKIEAYEPLIDETVF